MQFFLFVIIYFWIVIRLSLLHFSIVTMTSSNTPMNPPIATRQPHTEKIQFTCQTPLTGRSLDSALTRSNPNRQPKSYFLESPPEYPLLLNRVGETPISYFLCPTCGGRVKMIFLSVNPWHNTPLLHSHTRVVKGFYILRGKLDMKTPRPEQEEKEYKTLLVRKKTNEENTDQFWRHRRLYC